LSAARQPGNLNTRESIFEGSIPPQMHHISRVGPSRARKQAVLACRIAAFALCFGTASFGLRAQDQPAAPGQPGQPDKRILGVLPNYRTARTSAEYVPLTARQKLYIGMKDSTDYPIYVIGGAFAALNQMDNNNPSFGQGMKGYGKRYAASFADQAIGNMLAESLVPVALHEDPRYFQLLSGTGRHRTFYALTRVFVTKTDSGGSRINASELLGNGIAVGISNLYYKDNRDVGDNLEKWGTQIATDMFSNVLKEFWPDVKRRYFSRHHAANTP
jgi:hypothetical protein